MSGHALAAKVRAMYGKRLKREDFAKLTAMKSIAEVIVFLKQTPGWGPGLRDYSLENANRASLITALHRAEYNNYMKLFHYLSAKDKDVMHFPVLVAEMEEVMSFMRLAARGLSRAYACTLPLYLRAESKIHYQELSEAKDYAGLLNAVRNADFYAALQRIAPADGSLPPYAQVEIIMQGYYYRAVYATAKKSYGSDTGKLMLKSFGQQIDMINIIHAMRVRKFFPGMADNIAEYLLPVYYRIKPSHLKALLDAKDDAEATALLTSGPYRKLYTANTFCNIEEYYYKLMYDFHHLQIRIGRPSVMTAVSYQLLKQIEVKNLIHAVECVYYGIAPEAAGLGLLVS